MTIINGLIPLKKKHPYNNIIQFNYNSSDQKTISISNQNIQLFISENGLKPHQKI